MSKCRCDAGSVAETALPSTDSQEEQAVEPTRSQRILVVDDEPSIVDAVATSLRYEGFGVDEAVNGRLALAAAQENPPDLIVWT